MSGLKQLFRVSKIARLSHVQSSRNISSSNCNLCDDGNKMDGDKKKGNQFTLFRSNVKNEEKPTILTPEPISRTLKVMGLMKKDETDNIDPDVPRFCDVVVIGGGIVGSSVAYWLRESIPDGIEVVVVDKDLTYSKASTTLSVGGIRQQFSIPENIQMSLYGAEFLRNANRLLNCGDSDPPDIQFHPHGYLMLASEKGAQQLMENVKVQNDFGAKVALLTSTQLKDRFPWINTDGIACGAFGLENEGWFDPWALLSALRRKNKFFGTEYVEGEVIGVEDCNLRMLKEGQEMMEYRTPRELRIKTKDGKIYPLRFAVAVICAGHASGEVARQMGIGGGDGLFVVPVPVEPRKRFVYCVHSHDGPGMDCPLVVDPSGVYFRREGLGGHYLVGASPEESEEPSTDNLDVDDDFFKEKIWPKLAERVPSFNSMKVSSAWAGFYDYNTYDQNAILGPHPIHNNIFIATGFSGHGLQQAPAAGRAIAELILHSNYQTLDLTRFRFERMLYNDRLVETNIV